MIAPSNKQNKMEFVIMIDLKLMITISLGTAANPKIMSETDSPLRNPPLPPQTKISTMVAYLEASMPFWVYQRHPVQVLSEGR